MSRLPLDQVDAFVTDGRLPSNRAAELRSAGLQVVLA